MTVWARGTQGKKFDHAAQYAKQEKISLKDAYALFGIEEPQKPKGFEFIWDWYFELAQTRTQNGFGWNPIGWTEMDAWSRIAGIDLQPWLANCFVRMDQAWLAVVREQNDGRKNGRTETANRGRRCRPRRH